MEEKRMKAPIDGKNVLEDWEWLADDGNVLEHSNGADKTELFFCEGHPCILTYMRGGNAFHVHFVGGGALYGIAELCRRIHEVNECTKETGLYVETELLSDSSILASFWWKEEVFKEVI